MGPIRRKRIDKKKEREAETDFAKREQLKSEIDHLADCEKEERRDRIEQQSEINKQIEELAKKLKIAGVDLKFGEKPKKEQTNRELAPPILGVTINLELDGARNLLGFFKTQIGKN